MALLDSEGFGLSYSFSDFLSSGGWSLYRSQNPTFANIYPFGPLGDNYVGVYAGVSVFIKTWRSPADSTFFWGGRVNTGAGASGGSSNTMSIVQMGSTGTGVQGGIRFSPTGVMSYYRGGSLSSFGGWSGGTLLGTSPAGGFPTSGWHYLEIGGTIDATSGNITVRVDGVDVPGLVFTGVNTRGDSSNLVTGVGIQANNNNSNNIYVSHMYFADGTGPAPNNTFLGDVRVQTATPVSDDAVGFTPVPGSCVYDNYRSGQTPQISPTTTYYSMIQAPASGDLSSLRFYETSYSSGSCQAAIYSDNGGSPGVLLASTPSVPVPTTGYFKLTPSSTIAVVGGQIYWVAFRTDTSYLYLGAGSNGALQGATESRSYASGFPSVATPILGNAIISVGMQVNTAANWENASEQNPANSTGANSSSVAGTQDTFGMDPLGGELTTVFGVNVKSLVGKTGAGLRFGASVIKSSGTLQVGGSVSLPSTPSQVLLMAETDPATGLPWTPSAVNALKAGYKIIS